MNTVSWRKPPDVAPEQLLNLARAACDRMPGNVTCLKRLAGLCLEIGNRGEARAALEEWLLAEPESPDARIGLVEVALEEERFADALEFIDSFGLESVPLKAEAQVGLGQLKEAERLTRDGADPLLRVRILLDLARRKKR